MRDHIPLRDGISGYLWDTIALSDVIPILPDPAIFWTIIIFHLPKASLRG